MSESYRFLGGPLDGCIRRFAGEAPEVYNPTMEDLRLMEEQAPSESTNTVVGPIRYLLRETPGEAAGPTYVFDARIAEENETFASQILKTMTEI